MENLGTIWVCVDCMLHHANDECGSCHDDDGHDQEPLSAIGEGFHVAMGMRYEDHLGTCERRPLECTECANPATHAVWWEESDGTRHGEPRCGELGCMGPPAEAVAGGTAPIPTPFPVPDGYECDCETRTYSTSQCEGCGSYLHGERHAMTLFRVRIQSPKTYKVIRFYKEHPSISQRTLKRGLSRGEAVAHCKDPETSSSTCEKRVNVRRTEWLGPWFDGWTEE